MYIQKTLQKERKDRKKVKCPCILLLVKVETSTGGCCFCCCCCPHCHPWYFKFIETESLLEENGCRES